MSHLRFNHVFVSLMLLSAACAFVIPTRLTNPLRAQFQNVFAPVSRPLGALAAWVHGRVRKPQPIDARDTQAIARENDQLKTRLASLQAQLGDLQDLNADRQLLGEVLPLCTPVPVVGGDAGARDSISIQSTHALSNGMFALYSGGVVGRLDRVGVSGAAQVRLITDPGFAVTGCFGRVEPGADGQMEFHSVETPPPLVQGAGRGAMVIRRLDFDSVKGVKVGDWLVVHDRDWPANLQGYRLGRVTSIDRSTSSSLFAEIQVRPATNLMQLREVMVMNKTTPTNPRSARTE